MTLAAVLALAGCQAGGTRPGAVTELGTGYLAAEMRTCFAVEGVARECETEATSELDTAELALSMGLEVPAWAARAECERGRSFEMMTRAARARVTMTVTRCEAVGGVMTQGRGWQVAVDRQGVAWQVCDRAGHCKPLLDFLSGAAADEVEAMFAGNARVFAEIVKLYPTYSTRFACEEAQSAVMTKLAAEADDEGLMPEGGTVKVRCKRYW